MTETKRQMRLGAFLSGAGHHLAAWRYPGANVQGILDFQHYKYLAQLAERGKFDMIFFADILAVSENFDTAISRMAAIRPEPITLLSALSVVTEHIGLTGTLSSTFSEPYNVARQFAMLDHLSNGRAAWNVVTTSNQGAAGNFGESPHLDHHLRYERAKEYLDVVSKLWDSWEDDALILDKENGLFADKDKVHAANHHGTWFSVRGPLNMPRSPQGRPVVIQAGSSADGRDFAAQTAEVIFTAWQTLEEARAFYQDVKSRAVTYGRSEGDLLILPGVLPIIGETDDEALRKYEHFQSLIHPEAAITLLSGMIGHDLTSYDSNAPFPDLPDISNGVKGRLHLIQDIAKRDQLSILEVSRRIAGARGHWTIFGTPSSIADQLESWFVGGGCDGFNIMAPYFPGGLEEFVDLVLPELRKRGLFRNEYEGTTLRENLGLSRPANRYAKEVTPI
ncbi:LLM class flavin-dependent oxidoreductase [Paenibacillus qinlingensis]|uniref:FMN-dependent oxidoreductase (Nitrilotriacetate monooxygenase family) n=1 Tax=Paenibacillus qinlingensis TaxID=1837343 RepID=A0ABU1NSW9_9BACL|nr:LLM class flavin-dependent oxidoreductase [Paenibacillus qinlingensis]MDR6550550.1 FMN-dependent oxidoreductase (nitrilotriacetate monooxygenase family) [Paenibacillus qinlingensis]